MGRPKPARIDSPGTGLQRLLRDALRACQRSGRAGVDSSAGSASRNSREKMGRPKPAHATKEECGHGDRRMRTPAMEGRRPIGRSYCGAHPAIASAQEIQYRDHEPGRKYHERQRRAAGHGSMPDISGATCDMVTATMQMPAAHGMSAPIMAGTVGSRRR